MQWSAGQTFAGRYRLERVLGDGGFASVWEATDPEVGRRVAIKVIRPDESGEYTSEIRERFKREAAAVANLQDPHTVTLFDYGEFQGALYLVFELVQGESLGSILRRSGPVDPAILVKIVRQVLHSLREAHQAGILHRDIKPDNVIVYEYMGDPYRAKLVDFGLVKPAASAETDGLTRPGLVMGTARFVSPEGYKRQPLSPASDIFSLGVSMYEALTGSPANTKSVDMEVAIEQASDREFEIPDSIPPPLRPIIRRMIAKNPVARYQSAGEVLGALDGIEGELGAQGGGGDGRVVSSGSDQEFTATDLGGGGQVGGLKLDQEALAQRGAAGTRAPRPRNRIQTRKKSGSVVKFALGLTVLLVAASVGVIWYLDLEMPWNEVEPVDPATLSPKVFGVEAADTIFFYVDWSRGIVYADDPLTIPAPGRCAVILDSRSDPTPPGAFYVTNGLDGYHERVEAEPIGRDELAKRAELCAGAGEAAWYVQQSAEVIISEIRIEQAQKKGGRKIDVEQVRGRMNSNPYKGAPTFKMPDLSKIPGMPR